jgi:hypothetical protein
MRLFHKLQMKKQATAYNAVQMKKEFGRGRKKSEVL